MYCSEVVLQATERRIGGQDCLLYNITYKL